MVTNRQDFSTIATTSAIVTLTQGLCCLGLGVRSRPPAGKETRSVEGVREIILHGPTCDLYDSILWTFDRTPASWQ
jgi:hypothetical protein